LVDRPGFSTGDHIMRSVWTIFLARFGKNSSRSSRPSRISRVTPCLEALEDRTVPAPVVDKPIVVSSADTLTAAINDVNKNTKVNHIGDIEFDSKLAGQTITLKKALLPAITKPVYINTNGVAVTIDGELKSGAGLDFESGSNGSKVFDLTIQHFSGDGILLRNVMNVQIGDNGPNEAHTQWNPHHRLGCHRQRYLRQLHRHNEDQLNERKQFNRRPHRQRCFREQHWLRH
jgi:hypothetical protein